MPRLVGREQLTAAAALMSLSQNAMFLLGSSLGGILAVTPGPWLVYGLDAAGLVISFAFLTGLDPLPRAVRAEDGDAAEPGSPLRQITAGLRYAVQRRDLLGSYLADLAAMSFAYPNALFPFMAAELHAHGLAIALSAATWGLGVAGFGLSPGIYLALGCLVVAGGADMISGIFRETLWNQTIPDELRGRLAGVELLSYGLGPPAGQFPSGVVASLVSSRFSLVSGGLACVAAVAAVGVLLPSFVRYEAAPART